MWSSSLNSLQVVDCVLEKCMFLTSARAKGLCSYLLCARGVDASMHRPSSSLLPASSSRLGRSSDVRPSDGLASAGDVGDRPVDVDGSTDDDYAERVRRLVMAKRWQYPDPLQHCVQTHCQDERGVDFYTCVYKRCISALLKGQFPDPE